MVIYGIYPGVARRDTLTALCHYSWDDYRRVFGGDLRAYLDFLVEQEEAAQDGDDPPYRVVRVPFVPQRFAEWLAGHPGWKDDPEGHGAWALAVAQDPAALRAIREEVPLLTRAPSEERTASSTLFVAVLTMYAPGQDPGALGRTLPPAFLAQVGGILRASLGDPPPFVPVSPLRSEGIAIVPGNRFVDPERAEDAAEVLESQALRDLQRGSPPGPAIPVPRPLRLHAEADPQRLQTVVLLLPVVLIGPQDLIEYVEERWAAVPGFDGRALGECFQRNLLLPAPPPGVHYDATILPPYLVDTLLDSILEELDTLDALDPDDEDEDDEDGDGEDDFPPRPPGRHGPPGPHGRRHIRRIK